MEISREELEEIVDEKVENRLTQQETAHSEPEAQGKTAQKESDSSLSRRSFLKALGGGAAGLGAAAMIPSAAGLRINSDQGLSYYNSSSANRSQFEVGPNGILDAQQIGTDKNPVGSIHSETTNTEELSRTIYAAAKPGATGAEKLQNAIDAAASLAGSATVTVDDAPDDLSGYSNADQSEGWLIDRVLKHKSGVHIECKGNPYSFLDFGVGRFLENADISNGDSNLGLVGGTWDCHGANNDNAPGDKKGNFYYQNVSDVEFSPNEIKDHGPNLWAIHFADWENLEFGTIKIDGDKDGLHLHGPGKGASVERVYGDAGDDMLALTTAEYDTHNPTEGDITDVHIGEVDERDTTHDEGAMALAGNSDYIISDVTVDTIRSADCNAALRFRPDPSIVGDGLVNVSDFHVGEILYQNDETNGAAWDIGGSRHRNISAGTIKTDNVASGYSHVRVRSGTIDSLTIGDIQDSNSGSERSIEVTGGTVRTLTIKSATYYDFDGNAIIHQADGTLERIIISNLSYTGAGGAGGTGTGGPIVRTTSQPTRLRLANCDISYADAIHEAVSGGSEVAKISNCDIKNCGRLAEADGTLDLSVSNSSLLSFGNNPFYVFDGATVDITTRGADADYTNVWFQTQTSTHTLSVDGQDWEIDITTLTPSEGDVAYNDGSTSGSTGPYIYDGTDWVGYGPTSGSTI